MPTKAVEKLNFNQLQPFARFYSIESIFKNIDQNLKIRTKRVPFRIFETPRGIKNVSLHRVEGKCQIKQLRNLTSTNFNLLHNFTQ